VACEHIQIDLHGSAGKGILIAGCASGTFIAIRVQNESGTDTTGFCFDGINISCFFNTMINCYALSNDIGYDITSSGTSAATQQTFLQCSAFGSKASRTNSIGWKFQTGDGQGTIIVGGNAENCKKGIECSSSSISIDGVRFEDNTLDIELNSTSFGCSVTNCKGLETLTQSEQNGFGQHTIWGNHGPSNIKPFPNSIEAVTKMLSNLATSIPLTIQGRATHPAAS